MRIDVSIGGVGRGRRYLPPWAAVVAATAGAVLALPSSASAATALNMIGLGDSYSAGVGLGGVSGGCDQDRFAYAPRARNDILPRSHRINGLKFVACSGHRTSDVLSNQVPFVNASHNVAAITVGGNDIGFGPKLRGCYFGRCGPDTFSLQADVRGGTQTWSQLHSRMANTYVAIRRRMNASGHLYVLTYPIPFSRRSDPCSGLDGTEQNAANALVTRLDDTIYHAVASANALSRNVHFVDWRTGTRVDRGYRIPTGYSGAGGVFPSYVSPDGLCNTQGRTPFINPYVFPAGNSFHPNSTGYWRGAQLLAAAIRKFQP